MEFVVSPVQRAILVRGGVNDEVLDVITYMGLLWDNNRTFTVYTIFDRVRIDLVTPEKPSKWHSWGSTERSETLGAFNNAMQFKHFETQEAIDEFNAYFDHIHPERKARFDPTRTISKTTLDQFW